MLFDGVCGLCTGTVKFIIRHDGRSVIRFAALQSELGREFCERYGIVPGALDTIVLVDRDVAFVESEAALRVAAELDRPWCALSILRVVPRFVRDLAYRFVASRRHRWFGELEACWVPTAELAKRFLDVGDANAAERPSTFSQ